MPDHRHASPRYVWIAKLTRRDRSNAQSQLCRKGSVRIQQELQGSAKCICSQSYKQSKIVINEIVTCRQSTWRD